MSQVLEQNVLGQEVHREFACSSVRGWDVWMGQEMRVCTGGGCQQPGNASAMKNTFVATKSPLAYGPPIGAAGSPRLSAWIDLPILDKTTSFSLDQ